MKFGLFQSMVVASVFFATVALWSLHSAVAQVMRSTNYQIESDSINTGGRLSSSNNYISESTIGELATGESNSASYVLRAGYQQMQEVYIAISGASSVALAPSIPGVTGGTSNGSTTVRVTTDSLAGYQLTIKADTSPAMQSGVNSIADYSPNTANPDFTFITGSADSHLGYTPEGSDVVQRFLDDGNACNIGSGDTSLACWDGLSTSEVTVASASAPNHPSGTETSIRFRVGVGSAVVQAVGNYIATTTITALPL